jgi:hypothetical protein
MKFTIQVLIESPEALPLSVPVQTIERKCDRVEDVGLRLEEAKAIMMGLQEHLARQQLAKHLQSHRPCPCCHRPRNIKGYHSLRFRSAFGDLRLRSPRWLRCSCEDPSTPASYSALNALLTTHTAPELEFLQAKWAAHLSFAAVADLLHDVLPTDAGLHGDTIRTHVFKTAERLEAELGPEQFAFEAGCQLDIEESPEPGPPVTVGLDGGYIRGSQGLGRSIRSRNGDYMRSSSREIRTLVSRYSASKKKGQSNRGVGSSRRFAAMPQDFAMSESDCLSYLRSGANSSSRQIRRRRCARHGVG